MAVRQLAAYRQMLAGRRQLQAFQRRPEASQQRIDGQGDDAQHRDFAEGIEAAEVHQYDVDDIGAAAHRAGPVSQRRSEIPCGCGRVMTA